MIDPSDHDLQDLKQAENGTLAACYSQTKHNILVKMRCRDLERHCGQIALQTDHPEDVDGLKRRRDIGPGPSSR